MAWEENPRICLHMQLIAILSRTGVKIQKKLKKNCFVKMKNNLSNYPTEMNESFRIMRNPKRIK